MRVRTVSNWIGRLHDKDKPPAPADHADDSADIGPPHEPKSAVARVSSALTAELKADDAVADAEASLELDVLVILVR